MKLNLGCGDIKKDGYINVDECGTPDVVCDLSVFPWPWADGSVDEIYASHFLEHVTDYEKTILEIHRILKKDGVFHFIVPHFRSPSAQWHLHHWPFSTYTPQLLCQSIAYQWGGKKLFCQRSLSIRYQLLRPRIAKCLETIANISPTMWDWLGLPIEEIEFIGVKGKE